MFWMTAKYSGTCVECETRIHKGERMVWDQKERKAYCATCGPDALGPDPQAPDPEF